MKKILITSVSIFNSIVNNFLLNKGSVIKGSFYFFKLKFDKKSYLKILETEILKSTIEVRGLNNIILVSKAHISDSIITVEGNGNEISIGEGVLLRKSNLIIRGNGSKIEIGKGTTFGGIRIINVGSNNTVFIGENCLFSDQIELWSSDTHAIYDKDGKWINKEKPVFIGNNVWVGSRVTILKGVTVEDGSIIGMGSLITKNVPKHVIVAGAPGKVIKEEVSWSLDYPL